MDLNTEDFLKKTNSMVSENLSYQRVYIKEIFKRGKLKAKAYSTFKTDLFMMENTKTIRSTAMENTSKMIWYTKANGKMVSAMVKAT